MSSKQTVSLVLGSGGARGLAHIGVIKWLEEHDYNIVSISGSSMGALIGGIYAVGKLDEYEHWVRAITATDIVKLLDISLARDGLVRGERIIETLKGLIGDQLIEDLPIPFTAVAADVVREKEVWLNTGSLFDAIRASISLPLFFQPAEVNGVKLLDGGILNPVPIAPTFNDDSDITIAVNLGGKPDPGFPVPELAAAADEEADFADRIAGFIKGLDVTKRITEQVSDKVAQKSGVGMLEIADRTFDAMQSAIARQQLAAYPPDIELVIPNNVCGTLEFDRAEQMIQLGYELAERRLGGL
jgi:NTE family protein